MLNHQDHQESANIQQGPHEERVEALPGCQEFHRGRADLERAKRRTQQRQLDEADDELKAALLSHTSRSTEMSHVYT